ncbi:PREDICTED: solute carrier family 46 member 3 isoform X2 [Chinchilla lanigera]|uniref:Lysosomal proton-coupled steroid conjugate and bile acid symporter SLC46A3 n=2 Tax=Chinchilla lanigera TaxID=34839 RepID=A0A8C2YPE8_CHILA|nr:PREDICTED: solute carrier family 46 member 3 isoform X2 [Chinchilla lanigera]
MKIFFVEPAIFLNAFAMSLTTPLTTQYLYRRIWEDTGNYSFAFDSNISQCGQNESSTLFAFQKEVQKKVSLFSLQMEMSGLIPGLVSTFILLSSSDQRGRKFPLILSSTGVLVTNVWLCLLCYFAFPLPLLIASTFIGAFFGSFHTFWSACFAYVVDQCKESKQKTIRIAIIDCMVGIVSGLTALSSGYFIRQLGFVWSFLITSIALAINLAFIVFFLGESVNESSSQSVPMSCIESFKTQFQRTYMLFKNASGKQQPLLCLFLFTVVIYFFVIMGIFPVFILYELGSPLCWNEVLVGYGSALDSVSFLGSFLGIWLFSYCMEDIYIAFIGIFTTMAGIIMTAFAKTTLMMFLVRVPCFFLIAPLSVLRSMLSGVIPSTEQGTLFACIAFLETLGGVIAVSAFNGIYSATVAWYPGFVFLLAAGILLIPVINLCAAKWIMCSERSYTVLAQKEPSDDTSD